ncbi:MAG: DUF2162 domain-containing protein [Thermodesulfobacteriaceae bacterium]|nr:DUF2162 domain-containing protein [Thermodesulfobacteriaceae bacterium]
MDLNILLWIGGMLFSLSIFAIKVGFGLGFSRIKWKGIFLTLSVYLILFILIAVVSERLIKILEPILRKGPYLHVAMALGMIAWGIYIILRSSRTTEQQVNSRRKILPSRIHHALLLLVPCPVCLTAMTFSTWSALNVFKFSPVLVGLSLGIIFILLSLGIYFYLKLATRYSLLVTQGIGLGLSMLAIGFYYIASLSLPAKIEEAKNVYKSFLTEASHTNIRNYIGIFVILFIGFLSGFLRISFSGVTKRNQRIWLPNQARKIHLEEVKK